LLDYTLIDNNSKVYFNGTKWNSNNCGEFEIVGKTNRHHMDKRGYPEYKYYLCKFKDGSIVESKTSEIKIGKVRNPNHPSLKNVGFLGVGNWRFYINQTATCEYALFHNIIDRCYNDKNISFKNYGAKGVILDKPLHNFQNFCNMISNLPNYDKWKYNTDEFWELDKDIICEELGIYPKIYSEKTSQFITRQENVSERNKRVSITGLSYEGINKEGLIFKFTNIREFSKEHDLQDTNVGRCLRGLAISHKGWKFKTLTELE